MILPGLSDFQFKDQRVLLRLDLNAPIEDGLVSNDERLVRSLPTINHILQNQGKLIVISHLGRPKENGKLQTEFSLRPVVKRLEQLLNRSIILISDINKLPSIASGEMIILENVRFLEGEKSNDPVLSRKLADLADIFVMDAFATSHRAHSSTTGVIKFSKKACAGFLLQEEVDALLKFTSNNNGKSLAVLGGAKISTKLDLINSLCAKMDNVILGGGIANTCLLAQGFSVGNSLVEESMLEEALELSKRNNVILPKMVVTADNIKQKGTKKSVDNIREDESIFDIAPESFEEQQDLFRKADTILWNGPMGLFEEIAFAQGTNQIANMIVSSKGFSVAGGGDTISAADKAGVLKELDYVSTAGGAFLEFIEGRNLPSLEALQLKWAK